MSHQPPLIQIGDSPLWWQLTFCLLAVVTWNSLKECHAAWSDEGQLHGRELLPLRWKLTCHTLQAYKWASGHVPNVREWSLFFVSFSSWHLVWQVLTGGAREGSAGQDGELTHPVCFGWHCVNETNRRSLFRAQKKRYLELVPGWMSDSGPKHLSFFLCLMMSC